MIKYNEDISFTPNNINVIEKRAKAVFEDYLDKNYTLYLSVKDEDYLIGKVKDQLTIYIKELSDTNDPWSMSNGSVFVTVLAKKPIHENNLLDNKVGSERKYYKKKNKWYLEDENNKGRVRKTFEREVMNDIYSSAEVAAFYAIDSFFNAKAAYPNG